MARKGKTDSWRPDSSLVSVEKSPSSMRRARLGYDKENKDCTIEDWSVDIFFGESSSQLYPTAEGLMVRWRPGEAYKSQSPTPTMGLGGRLVRIWRGIQRGWNVEDSSSLSEKLKVF